MLVVISPAKTLDFQTEPPLDSSSQPRLIGQTAELIKKLKTLSPKRIGALMAISDDLASLNHQRFQDFEIPHPGVGTRPALYAFQGDVYRGLRAADLTKKQVQYANDHLRMLSGLYGVLRPLDAMLPYRLEMGTSLPIGKHKQLYDFWGDQITDVIRQDIEQSNSKILLNLASKEYFKAVREKNLETQVVSPAFKEMKNGEPKIITVYAKTARGVMANWVMRNKVRTIEKLKQFADDGYQFSAAHSTQGVPVFLRT